MNERLYMQRCLQLAALGLGHVAPNPVVGAVLVHQDRIIGEGWHQQFGKAHAEVNAIADAIRNGNEQLLATSTMFVSLEPCAHYGKTPPCADLIIHHHIPSVVIGCRDPFPAVNGKGIEKLTAAGVTVTMSELEPDCRDLNRRFFTFHQLQRPYIILKWATTADGFIGAASGQRLLISHALTNRLVHRWRSEEAGILVGSNTVQTDNPELTVRLWKGSNPMRIIIDRQLSIPGNSKVLDGAATTIIFNHLRHEETGNLVYYQLKRDEALLPQLLRALYERGIQSVLVEGGSITHQHFLDAGLWDEARIITNRELYIGEGIAAPRPGRALLIHSTETGGDQIDYFRAIHN